MCHGMNLNQRATALQIFFARAKEGLKPGCAQWLYGLSVEEHVSQVGSLSLLLHFHKNIQKILTFLPFFEQTLDIKPPESSCAPCTALLAGGCHTGSVKATTSESWLQPVLWHWIRTTSLPD